MSAKSLIMAILTVLLSLILMVGSAWAGEPIDRTAPASPDGSVEISNVAGSVTILGWDREEIRVTTYPTSNGIRRSVGSSMKFR